MKILTTNVNKGGAGKTTFTHNFAEWLRKKHRVLLLDFDDSANLTNRYGYYNHLENTVVGLFDNGKAVPIHVADNLDLIAGHREVEDLKGRVNAKRRREEIFGRWLGNNEDWLEEHYDYVLIDTENDEGILTQNAIIVSDVVVSLSKASKDGFNALMREREFVNELSHDFDMNVDLLFLGSEINLSENPSTDLLEDLVDWDEYVGYIPKRTVLADDHSIFSKKLNSANLETAVHLAQLFERIKGRLDQAEGVSS